MEHVAKAKDGALDPKLLKVCSLPLTGKSVVDMVITDLGVFRLIKRTEGWPLLNSLPG